MASSRVAQKPCDGRRGITTAPVMVHFQGRSSGTPPLALKIRPMSRPCERTAGMSVVCQHRSMSMSNTYDPGLLRQLKVYDLTGVSRWRGSGTKKAKEFGSQVASQRLELLAKGVP
jgi:hypothetical protein